MSKTVKQGAVKVSEVEWITEAKRILGEPAFNSSPLNIIAKKDWAKRCKLVTHENGTVFINAGEELQEIYILVKGRISIGGASGPDKDTHYVERLIVEPFSFIGEIEAPMELAPKCSNKADFKKISFQDNAWVSSEALSKLLSWRSQKLTIKIPEHNNALLKDALNWLCHSIDENSDDERENKFFGTESELYANNGQAVLLSIPEAIIPQLLEDDQLRYNMYEDAFIKAKKYCYIYHLSGLGEKILAIYDFAESNRLLTKGSLFIFGPTRLHALTEDSEAKLPRNRTKIKKFLENKKLLWEEIPGVNIHNVTTKLPIREVQYMWRLSTAGPGGNSTVYKISRMSNT